MPDGDKAQIIMEIAVLKLSFLFLKFEIEAFCM